MRKVEHGERLVSDLVEMMLDADAHSGARRPRNQVRVQIADAPLEHRAHVDVTDHASGILSGIVICTCAPGKGARFSFCLLYTSDAADERSSVDLGGRRII